MSSLSEMRSSMIFRAYASKNLDAISTAFADRYKREPRAFMARSPFGIFGNIEHKRNLVISKVHCGSDAVFVPLLLDKEKLEINIAALGETARKIYVERRRAEKIEKLNRIVDENQKRTYVRHCPYCGVRYITDVVKPAPTCGKIGCESDHRDHIKNQKEIRAKSQQIGSKSKIVKKFKSFSEMPEFSLDSPHHDTLQGYVYCILAENGLCKIGRSDNVEKRFANLKSMSPVDLYLEHTVFSDNYVAAESFAHGELADYRHHGEWFDLPENVFKWFLSLDNYDLDVD